MRVGPGCAGSRPDGLESGDGKIRTLQYIDAAGAKLFLKDGAIEGNYSSITDGSGRRDILLICEGWATGATLHEATGLPVVVAFNAGNLLPVAKVIREKYPATRLVICADNDLWKPEVGNVGVSKATAAAQAVGADLAVPDVAGIEGKPTDFNDVAVARGLGAVLAQLNSVLDPARP
jgi:putative DNA primase/helicase